MTTDTRRLARRVLLAITVLGLAWSFWIAVTAGAEFNVLGVTITSYDFRRPLLFAGVALTFFVLIGGHIPQPPRVDIRAIARRIPSDRTIVLGLAGFVLAATWLFGSKTGGGQDSYGYVSQADLWREARLIQPQAWAHDVPWPNGPETFQPLAYTFGRDRSALVPIYAPGLPMLMAAAKSIGGHSAMFAIAPLSAALLILATYGIGVRIGSSRMGLVAAWLVATSAVFLFIAMAPMSDVPVSAAWALAFFFTLGRGSLSAAAAGFACGVAALIRLNLTPMVAVPSAWYVARVLAAPKDQQLSRFADAMAFALGFLPGAIAAGLITRHFYGAPFRSGYGPASELFSPDYAWPNIVNYTSWLVETQTPLPFLGLIALVVPTRWLWPFVPSRGVVLAFAAFVVAVIAQYLLYFVFDAWWYLRFLLPCWPFIMLGVAAWVSALARAWPAFAPLLNAAIFAVGVFWARYDAGVLDIGRQERRYAVAAQMVTRLTEPGSVVLAMQHSGSIRYYAGRMTLMYPALDRLWLDGAVRWMRERGVRAYALLDEGELRRFREHFGATELGRLRFAPVGRAEPWGTVLFDLSSGGGEGQTRTFRDLSPYAAMAPALPPAPPFSRSGR